eukprot:6198403-Pleurochrysis_carterae.AAC.1
MILPPLLGLHALCTYHSQQIFKDVFGFASVQLAWNCNLRALGSAMTLLINEPLRARRHSVSGRRAQPLRSQHRGAPTRIYCDARPSDDD